MRRIAIKKLQSERHHQKDMALERLYALREAIRDDIDMKLKMCENIMIVSTLMLGSTFEFISQAVLPTFTHDDKIIM
jgi:hypothetical protein